MKVCAWASFCQWSSMMCVQGCNETVPKHTPLLHTSSLNKMKPYNTSLTSCILQGSTQRACHVDSKEEHMTALFDNMQTMFILLPCSYVWHLHKPNVRCPSIRKKKQINNNNKKKDLHKKTETFW